VLLVQAKDSPNTETSLRKSMDRKRAVIRAHIEKGAKQLQGALSYVKENREVVLREAGGRRLASTGARKICGLVVVRELFDDDYQACSAPVLSVAKACEEPCVLMDYAALHLMALYLPSPIRLCNGLFHMFDLALGLGEYPKPRFMGVPWGEAEADQE